MPNHIFIYYWVKSGLDSVWCPQSNFSLWFGQVLFIVLLCYFEESFDECDIMYFLIPNRSPHSHWSITDFTMIWDSYLSQLKLVSCLGFLHFFLLFLFFFFNFFTFFTIFILISFPLSIVCFLYSSLSFFINCDFLLEMNSKWLQIESLTVKARINMRILSDCFVAMGSPVLYSNEEPYIEIHCETHHRNYILLLSVCHLIYHFQYYSQSHLTIKVLNKSSFWLTSWQYLLVRGAAPYL